MSSAPDPTDSAGNPLSSRESKLALAAEAEVTRLIKAKTTPKWWGRVLIALCVVLAIVVGYLLYYHFDHPVTNQIKTEIAAQGTEQRDLDLYVQQYAQHGCQALELLTSVPVHKPANPAANPSRETTYQFYEAILYWEHADGCTLTSVPVAHG